MAAPTASSAGKRLRRGRSRARRGARSPSSPSRLLVLAAAGYASLMFGAVRLSPGDVWSGLTSADDVFARNVVWQIRYPRLLDAMIVGAGLAVAGALLQGVTRNPLADPTILGVTAACGLASASLIVYDPQSPQWAIAIACVVGGLAGAVHSLRDRLARRRLAPPPDAGRNVALLRLLRRRHRRPPRQLPHLPADERSAFSPAAFTAPNGAISAAALPAGSPSASSAPWRSPAA
ncbi:iron chelate uptake ABC transporter family permease subunit [Tepidiforma flava]|uniref:Iron chelate uptake ABC transporter family permease subunit n=1 Tax=Tepidiforma flava TaxID=3004094 RepID=A0ABY7M2Z2_9CHLR|nr:iron chelate uptake ABC transporter family permease subunit [Tepidiforma flava]WBL35016.1 iron chelate uptake ABC transporter family permease subunit [Tepidiforma flava]